MNAQEKQFFEALSKDRGEIADVLERRAVRGYKESVVEKYSDQAHFIYELLQNADDAYATNARFVLEKNRLIFAHNGTRHFSVSNPANEDEDSKTKTLGDINAITSIANSNKTNASIGKFGVGFKAVFQYTSTPHIYDPSFKFKIERFIVPICLESDFPERQADETLFVFPFDHKERGTAEAYSDISDKLKNLTFPLLFLTNLKDIKFEIGNIFGSYDKSIEQTVIYNDTTAEHIVLIQNDGNELYNKELWLFSRLDEYKCRYSVGFFMDEEGRLCAVNEPAFCFFPTKEVTNLKFILHAPFLLTDSREGIRAGNSHNNEMIIKLAELSADALVHLRDIGVDRSKRLIEDNIVEIIPTNKYIFSDPKDNKKISFLPFFNKIKSKFESCAILPSSNGYVEKENAYWAAVPQLTHLFSNEQLSDITENEKAQWVFVSLGRDEVQRNNKSLFNYIEDLVKTNLNEDAVINGRKDWSKVVSIKGITKEFIERQPISWLHTFYKWLSETKHRTEVITGKPIFLDQNRNAVAAFDGDKQLILFMPDKDIEGYTVVNDELLENEGTKKFVKSIGIKQPSLKDQIYNIILPQYKGGNEVDTSSHFMIFFKFYCKCSNEEIEEFIDLIKDYAFLIYYKDGEAYREKASEMYMPNQSLLKYFASKPTTKFVDLQGYKEMVGNEREKYLISFLTELGVKTAPGTYTEVEDDLIGCYSISERFIDGLLENIELVEKTKNKDLSAFLWKQLCALSDNNTLDYHVLNKIIKSRPDRRYKFKTEYIASVTKEALIEKEWLVNCEGVFVSARGLMKRELSSIYDLYIDGAVSLLSLLDISDIAKVDDEENSNLTDEQKEKIALANKLRAYGIEGDEDFKEFLEYRRQKEARRKNVEYAQEVHKSEDRDANVLDSRNADNIIDEYDFEDADCDLKSQRENNTSSKGKTDVIKDIIRRTKDKPTTISAYTSEENEVDEDEYMPAVVDYSKKIESAKQKSAAEIDKITYYGELQNKALQAQRYSYEWFNTLLEMESINSGEINSRSREVSISFARVEREPETKRTLVLKYPNQYIPQFMEDLADIPLVLHIGEQTKNVAIEVVNIKSYTLRVKMKDSMDIDGIDLALVTSATINAKSPVFLLEELRKQFNEFEFDSEYNLQENLCENIEFVFGPPGTGKTTYLAKNILLPIMKNNCECKVLVLTPTNKSADVLIRRIMEVSKQDKSYENWLVRFGATVDEDIEGSPVFHDKTFDISKLIKNVTVTTIARFPYDFFMPQGSRIFLNGINWDYIIIDEASMIPLVNIVYPLYKKTPKKFIIAGDPFQIEPITSVDLWKNENIYTMVHLDSFIKPETIPYQYKVKLLTTQYRSVPDIGGIFSNFAYEGILEHYRSRESQRPLNLGNNLEIETLNIIKFPVSKYESIYRCKRLQHSSAYQVYSAIFTFEYISYLSLAIAEHNPGNLFKIGIIAPYRAQADMIDKLLASEKLPREVDIQVGTIHGFQGDECDIIFAVFNTPPTISTSKDMFLNKKNIINVSISRARDYLFIVMPDDETENISNLRLVKRIESLIHSTGAWKEFLSQDLEKLMFGDAHYLENNAFSTSHQSVNVYGLPEKIYEVRMEESAVDVQIHKTPSKELKHFVLPLLKSSDFDVAIKLGQSEVRRISVRGAISGIYYLIPYEGKLKEYTSKKVSAMFIPQVYNGKEKLISVSVLEEDKIIYIAKPAFYKYKHNLLALEEVELRRTYYH